MQKPNTISTLMQSTSASALLTSEPEEVYRAKHLPSVTGLSLSAIYEKISKGEFPEGFYVGPQTRCWTKSSIIEWQQATIQKSPAIKLQAQRAMGRARKARKPRSTKKPAHA